MHGNMDSVRIQLFYVNETVYHLPFEMLHHQSYSRYFYLMRLKMNMDWTMQMVGEDGEFYV